jgi:hypothetical protein
MLRRLCVLLLFVAFVSAATPASAARQTNGVDQCLQTASTVDLSTHAQIAVQMWLWWDAFDNNDSLAMEFSADHNAQTNAFIVNPEDSGFAHFVVGYHVVAGTYNTRGIEQPSPGGWHHVVFNIDRSQPGTGEITSIFVDGVSKVLQTDAVADSVGNFGNHTLYLMSRGCASLWGAGRIAEVAIWGGVNLSASQVASLYNSGNGALANTVGSVTHYWRLIGDASPEPATVGGINVTVTGATQVTHPFAPAATGACIIGGGFCRNFID